MFVDTGHFGFTRVLEENWRVIYDEFLGIKTDLIDWFEKDLYGAGWQVYGLFDFPRGQPLAEGIQRCPLTASLIQRHMPSHGAAGFSVMQPGTRIKPHTGYDGAFLRCHLGLRIPSGDCALQVKEEVRRWEDGKVMIFDDRAQHAAWNLTGQVRVILLIDFVPDTGLLPA
jgi:beta-hydroxylase